MNAYVIYTLNPEYPSKGAPYKKVAVYKGSTAHDALRRFAAGNGIEIGTGPVDSGKHWLEGRKRLCSWGKGQYSADKTTLPTTVAEAV